MNHLLSLENTTCNFLNQSDLIYQENLNKLNRVSSEQMESLFVNLMIKSMRSTHVEKNLLNSEQIMLYQSIYDQMLSDKISQKSIGLKNFFNKYFFQKV